MLTIHSPKLKALLSEGNTKAVIEKLMEMQSQIADNALQAEIILQAGRFHAFEKEKRLGKLSFEQETMQFAKINEALLEIIEQLPENLPFFATSWKSWAKWGTVFVTVVSVLAALVEISGYNVKEIFAAPKEVLAQEKTIQTPPDSSRQMHEVGKNQQIPKAEKNIPLQTNEAISKKSLPKTVNLPTLVKEAEKAKVDTKQEMHNSTSGNTVINNPTVNGQMIVNPSAPITIHNDFSTKKDTAKK